MKNWIKYVFLPLAVVCLLSGQSWQKLFSLLMGFALLIFSGQTADSNANLSANDEAVRRYNYGMAFSKVNFWDMALNHFEEAVAMDPNFTEAHFELANAYAAKKIYLQAVNEYKVTLHLKPSFAPAYFGLGRTYLEMKNFTSAVQYLQTSAILMPDDLESHYQLSMAYCKANSTRKALEEYNWVKHQSDSRAIPLLDYLAVNCPK